ncbi:MAG: hypothetical protein HQL71_15350 [Magnetococcales bacterium]|nr:hypothetical protein [Magnetococcales bacterium]
MDLGIPVTISLQAEGTLYEMVLNSILLRVIPGKDPNKYDEPDVEAKFVSKDIGPLISMLLYLCSEKSDITSYNHQKPKKIEPKLKKTKNVPKLQYPKKVTYWETGSPRSPEPGASPKDEA